MNQVPNSFSFTSSIVLVTRACDPPREINAPQICLLLHTFPGLFINNLLPLQPKPHIAPRIICLKLITALFYNIRCTPFPCQRGIYKAFQSGPVVWTFSPFVCLASHFLCNLGRIVCTFCKSQVSTSLFRSLRAEILSWLSASRAQAPPHSTWNLVMERRTVEKTPMGSGGMLQWWHPSPWSSLPYMTLWPSSCGCSAWPPLAADSSPLPLPIPCSRALSHAWINLISDFPNTKFSPLSILSQRHSQNN